MPDGRGEVVAALLDAVRAGLEAHADPTKAPDMQRYMKSALPFRGISARPLAALLRRIYDDHLLPDRASWETAVRRLWDEAAFREERYAAEALTGHRRYRDHQDPAALDLYAYLIADGAWWDHVDNLAIHRVGPILRTHHADTVPVVRAWATGADLWLRRSAVICQVGAKQEVDTDLLAEAIEANLEGSRYGSEFFVRKAVGWALRQHARVDPAWVREFVTAHEDLLSGLSRREALKHLG